MRCKEINGYIWSDWHCAWKASTQILGMMMMMMVIDHLGLQVAKSKILGSQKWKHNEQWVCEEVGTGCGQKKERGKNCSFSQDIFKNMPKHGNTVSHYFFVLNNSWFEIDTHKNTYICFLSYFVLYFHSIVSVSYITKSKFSVKWIV